MELVLLNKQSVAGVFASGGPKGETGGSLSIPSSAVRGNLG